MPPGDVVALADAIDGLLADAELRARFGAAGRRTVEREFDVAREAAWLGDVLSSALDGVVLAAAPDGRRATRRDANAPRTWPMP